MSKLTLPWRTLQETDSQTSMSLNPLQGMAVLKEIEENVT
jgi:hypothetical protein